MMATYLVIHVIGEGPSAAIFGDLVDLAYVAVPLAFAAMAWGLDHAPQRGRDEALPA